MSAITTSLFSMSLAFHTGEKPNVSFIRVNALYDIKAGQHEWTNLASQRQHTAKLIEMRALVPKDLTPVLVTIEAGKN